MFGYPIFSEPEEGYSRNVVTTKLYSTFLLNFYYIIGHLVVTNNKNNVYDIQFVSAMSMKSNYLNLFVGFMLSCFFVFFFLYVTLFQIFWLQWRRNGTKSGGQVLGVDRTVGASF